MNCRERQEFFSDLYDGNLPGDRRGDLESHLSSCADCRSEYGVFSTALHALREAAVPAPGEAFVRRVTETARGESERQALFQNTGLRRPPTRRMTASRGARWAVPAMAASALVAFALGFLLQKRAGDREIRLLQDRLAQAGRETPIREPGPSKTVPTEQEIIDRFLQEKNIVQAGGAWMSADIRDRLNRGEMKAGESWVDSRKEIARLVAEELAKAPGAPDPAALEERVLEKHGLVRRGEWIVPKTWAEALDRGQVLDGAGAPRDLASIVRERFGELGLVEHDGVWMRQEEKAQLLAARLIRNPGVPESAITRALEGLEIGPPLGYRNLTLYPLIATGDRTVAVTTLPEAFTGDRVEITDADALQVRVRNRGDVDLALFAGEILVGGRHPRVVARDSVVPAKKDRTVDVFDVDPSGDPRGPDKTAFRREAGAGHLWAPLGMRRRLYDEAGQGGVWASAVSSGARHSTPELYREHRAALLGFHTALGGLRTSHPGMTGVAASIGDCVAYVEVFGSPALLAAHFDRLVEAAAMEAIVTEQRDMLFASDLPSGAMSVKRLVESALGSEVEGEADAIAVRRPGGRPTGRALMAQGEAVRVVLFPDVPPPARPPFDLGVRDAKLQHVLRAYEARLQGANVSAARKSATIRELATLPGERSRAALLALANPGSAHRRDAVEALGLRGDPAAAEPLIRMLKDSAREHPLHLYPVLAQALTRIGSEDAIAVLIGDIDPKFPARSRVAAEYLPALLLGVRSVNTIESAVGSLIAALNRIPAEAGADPQGTSWPLKALRQVTGLSFVGPSDYHLWWSEQSNREDFLKKLRR